MANAQDLERLTRRIKDAGDDLDALKACERDLAQLHADVKAAGARATDPELQEELSSLEGEAEQELVDLRRTLRQVAADRLDPNYEKRKAEREAHEAASRQQAVEALKAFGGGLLGMLSGIAEKGTRAAQAGTAAAKAAVQGAAASCPACSAAVGAAAKFCPECGAPVQKRCPAGHPVEAAAKFCPECGEKV